MKTPVEHHDYGIYIDHSKAFIVIVNEFDRTQPALVRIELNPETQPAGVQNGIRAFTTNVIGHLQRPHRILVFGPAEEKYELHKELQRQGFDHGMKELIVSPAMEEAVQALHFTEKHFLMRMPF
jgi:hypothetical protein